MSPETIDKLKDYEKLMLQKRGIENELDLLKEEIIPLLDVKQPYATELNIFTVEERNKWTYSGEVLNAENSLEKLKKLEKQNGVATAEKTLVFYCRDKNAKTWTPK